MQFFEKLYSRISWLSLDVVLGGMAGMFFFEKLLQVFIPWEIYGLLALAIWSIYTLDHLLDAKNIPLGSTPDRHQFHLQFKRELTAVLVLAITTGAGLSILIFQFNTAFWVALGLAGLILFVMLLIRRFVWTYGWLKEFSTSVFYLIGICWYPYYAAEPLDIRLPAILLTINYLGIAFLNLLMLSFLDEKKDQSQGFPSLVTLLSGPKLQKSLLFLNLLLVALSLAESILFSSIYRRFGLILLLMAGVHYITFYSPRLSETSKRRRMEISFTLPWLLIFL
ncbi:hypothetical protein [Algoriphagus namhaensis]